MVRTVGKSSVPPTAGQLQNRAEMGAVTSFLKPLREFISLGFATKAKGTAKTPNNIAVSYNNRNAVTGIYPDVGIDYKKILVTQGGMAEPDEPAVELTDASLSFTWTYPSHLEWPRPNAR